MTIEHTTDGKSDVLRDPASVLQRHGQHASEPSIGSLVADAHESLSALIHGEIELAKFELRDSVKNAGTGVVFFVIAGVVALLSLPFLFVALAEGLVAIGLWRWLSYLLVFIMFMGIAGLSGFIGFKKVKKVKAPTETIETTKSTVAALRSVRQSDDS